MLSMDCGRCPAGPQECEGCIVALLLGEKQQLNGVMDESCGYVLDPEIESAIEVLLAAGIVSSVEIVGGESAA